MNIVTIPHQLRPLAGNRDHLRIELCKRVAIPTLRSLIDCMDVDAPGIKSRLLDQDGKLNRHVLVYVKNEDARTLREKQADLEKLPLLFPKHRDSIIEEPKDEINPLDLVLGCDDEVAIIPALAGG